MDQPYCEGHTARLKDSGIRRFFFDSVLVGWIFNNRMEWFGIQEEVCFLCLAGEDRLIACLKEAVEMEAGVTAGGGTLTTEKYAIFTGGTDDE